MPFRDPADAVLGDSAMVPESRRFCGRCDEPVGRGREGSPGRTAGFCRKCGAPFSFEPQLRAGDLVAGQYEVVGCLAHGGMGWVYLARDRNVSDRWVVLKGLLNAGDDDAMAAALAERRFLAEVEHPNIVKIFNFVQHESSGYIVMEYVGGRSLKQILAARREANGGEADPLPPAQAIAYMLEILPALGYLHQLGLLFCDFKIDNVIQTQHSLKLIDLGGVYRMDDPTSAVFGTVGYQAPEIAAAGPSIASDLFTVARTLAVLCFDFRGYQSTYRFTLPPQESVPLLARYDSLYRFLLVGTAPNPDDRFQSAEEMADQLYGVLREIVADQEGRAVPAAPSKLFSGPLRGGHERPDWRTLPRPQVDTDDPAAGYLATISADDPQQLDRPAERRARAHGRDRAAPRRRADRARRVGGGGGRAGRASRRPIGGNGAWSGTAAWPSSPAGGAHLARAKFAAVYQSLPGELAPKHALGLGVRVRPAMDRGRRAGTTSSRAPIPGSPPPPSASRAACSRRTSAPARWRRMSGCRSPRAPTSRRRPRGSTAWPSATAVATAGPRNCSWPAPPWSHCRSGCSSAPTCRPSCSKRRSTSSSEGRCSTTAAPACSGTASWSATCAFAVERSYRELARWASHSSERIQLVDRANQVRPRTWT